MVKCLTVTLDLYDSIACLKSHGGNGKVTGQGQGSFQKAQVLDVLQCLLLADCILLAGLEQVLGSLALTYS